MLKMRLLGDECWKLSRRSRENVKVVRKICVHARKKLGLTANPPRGKPIFSQKDIKRELFVKKYLYKNIKCSHIVSFRGQMKPALRPDWSPLGLDSNFPTNKKFPRSTGTLIAGPRGIRLK